MVTHLMDMTTGVVDTKENWLIYKEAWEADNKGIPVTFFDSLVPVIQDEEGNWIKKEK